MPYFRVDDGFPQHPKVLAIPRRQRAAAVGLWTLAGAWCQRNLTNGRLGKHIVEELGATRKVAELLVSTGLWTSDGEFYYFHEFIGWQGASRDEVLAKRDAEAERKRRWRENKAARSRQVDAGVPAGQEQDGRDCPDGTTVTVPGLSPSASGERPLYPYPPHTLPSPSLSYGEREEEETGRGNGTEVDAHASSAPLPPEPPLCRRHINWDRDTVPACAACGRLREQWQDQRDAATAPAPKPPWCGTCDETTRQIEVDDHTTARCLICHPLVGAA